MKKYDYKMETCSTEVEMFLKIKEMSSTGWRCVSATYNVDKNKYLVIFEKELIEE